MRDTFKYIEYRQQNKQKVKHTFGRAIDSKQEIPTLRWCVGGVTGIDAFK